MIVLRLKTFDEFKHNGSIVVVPTYRLRHKPFIWFITR